jgi:Tfp pilus assembly protein FimT
MDKTPKIRLSPKNLCDQRALQALKLLPERSVGKTLQPGISPTGMGKDRTESHLLTGIQKKGLQKQSKYTVTTKSLLSTSKMNPQPTKRDSGFTMIELLVVVAIMIVLVALTVPALTSMAKGNQMTQSLIEMSGLLEQARQYAISRNTYVWVAMRPNPNGANGDELSVAVLASKTGVDPSPWSSYGTVPNDQVDLAERVRTFDQIRFEEAGTFTETKIPALSGKTAATAAKNSPSQGTATFQIKLPGASSASAFNRVIQFTPNGEARVSSNVIDVIEFGLRPTRGKSGDENNVAVLRVNGLTGQTTVFRP